MEVLTHCVCFFFFLSELLMFWPPVLVKCFGGFCVWVVCRLAGDRLMSPKFWRSTVLLCCQLPTNFHNICISSSSSSRTDRWVQLQQNAGPRLFVHTLIVHGIDYFYWLTQTFGGFSAQCLSKLFLKEFTVLLITTSLDRAIQVVVILIG